MFKVQVSQGSYLAPDVSLRLADAESVAEQLNYEILDSADGHDWQSQYFSTGEWASGGIPLFLTPTKVTELFSWIQDRDSYNQGKYASIQIDCVDIVKKLTDAKVYRATFVLEKGRLALCTLDINAITFAAGTTASPTMPTSEPYVVSKELALSTKYGGGNYAVITNFERLTIDVDCMGEDPAEGLRLQASASPIALYNLSGVRCTGSATLDLSDTDLYDDWRAGQIGAIKAILTRGSDAAQLEMPRVLWTAVSAPLAGSTDQRIIVNADFHALGSTDGATAPITFSEP